MAHSETDSLISTCIGILQSDDASTSGKARELMRVLSERWRTDTLASRILKRFEDKREDFSQFLEDLLKEKLAQDPELPGILRRIISDESTDAGNDAETSRLSDEEIEVLKALEQIGGGGDPIDIAVEGMLDIEQTRQTAERLWRKGLLLSHPLRDPDARRFFSFSELKKDMYRKMLGATDAKLAGKF